MPQDPAPSATVPGPLGPTTQAERWDSIDTLRGVAVLGIFLMNIPTFAMTGAAFFNPPVAGGFEGGDYATWLVSHLFFDMKMMAIFSMLFGAGIVLMAERLIETGRRPAGVHYRRMLWLLAIGLAHAYLIWFGDILVPYALVGMMVYPLRRLSPRWLAVIGCCVLPVSMAMFGLMQAFFELMRGATSGPMAEAWPETKLMFIPTEASLEAERQKVMGGFVHRVAATAPGVAMMQITVFAIYTLWRAAGLMLLGMALHKWGVFKAERSTRFYATMVLAGGLLGGGLVAAGVVVNHRNGFDPVAFFGVVGWFNYVGSVGVALAWVGLVMLACKAAALGPVRRVLAAVGQMAFTNYLMQSVIAAFIFYGWGLGHYGQLSRVELVPIVLGVWAFQLIASPLWLKWFRFGPMEWLWRSLTYWKVEPLRRAA
jgi:uncharacterized protein